MSLTVMRPVQRKSSSTTTNKGNLQPLDTLQQQGERERPPCSRIIRKQNKEVKIIGLTSTNEAGIISQFLAKGGNGYLLKDMERYELLEAIDEVMNGKIYLSKAANQKILEQFNSLKDAAQALPGLTRREKEILKLLYDGFNGPQIAEKLFLSHYTIETHRKNLMQKLNVSSTQQLLKLALEHKLI